MFNLADTDPSTLVYLLYIRDLFAGLKSFYKKQNILIVSKWHNEKYCRISREVSKLYKSARHEEISKIRSELKLS